MMNILSLFLKRENCYDVTKNFCDNCLWYYKKENICTHYNEPNNPIIVNTLRCCDFKFDLKLNRDYDKCTIRWCKSHNPDMVNIDKCGNEYV